jgi:hypothetical protein
LCILQAKGSQVGKYDERERFVPQHATGREEEKQIQETNIFSYFIRIFFLLDQPTFFWSRVRR